MIVTSARTSVGQFVGDSELLVENLSGKCYLKFVNALCMYELGCIMEVSVVDLRCGLIAVLCNSEWLPLSCDLETWLIGSVFAFIIMFILRYSSCRIMYFNMLYCCLCCFLPISK